ELAKTVLNSGIGPDRSGVLVIRAGKDGSYSYSKDQRRLWLPAYHRPDSTQPSSVVDPTGAGNCFLGALAKGMVNEGGAAMQVIESVLESSHAWNWIASRWE